MTAISHDTGHAAAPRHQLRHLAVHQFRADLRCFYRNKQGVFFTLALPVLFLAIFGSVFQHQNVAVPGAVADSAWLATLLLIHITAGRSSAKECSGQRTHINQIRATPGAHSDPICTTGR